MSDREAVDGEPRVYSLHGLRLRSPIPLTGFLGAPDEYDLDVRWTEGKPVPEDPPPGRLAAAVAIEGSLRYAAATGDDGAWTLRVPRMCDFVVDRGLRSVECQLDPSTDPALVAVLVSGLVVAFLLTVHGDCVLHASAVQLDSKAIAFAGPSGSGKSTLAALFCAAGARLVTDDVLRLSPGPEVACLGGSPQVRLRPAATWALDHFTQPPDPTSTPDARLGIVPSSSDAHVVPLSMIVLPRLSREATLTEVRRHTGAGAVAHLATACRVSGWTDPALVSAQFRMLAGVASAVPVVEAVVPWRRDNGTALVDSLLDVLPGGPVRPA